MKKFDVKLLEHTAPHSAATVSLPAVSHNSSRRGMSPALSYILQEARRNLGYAGGTGSLQRRSSSELLEIVAQVAEKLGFELASFERDEILSHLEKDQEDFGILQQLIDDPDTSDIIVTDYAKISVQQGRRNYATDLSFPNQESYEAFVERLLQRAGSSYSTKKPISDGMIGSFARIHAVHRCLCETGPYLTIRLNRFSSVSIKNLFDSGLAPQPVFDYLSGIVRIGKTVLVVGEVGCGKTTLVRALAGSMPSHESILVIEDTPEIRLEHPHVRYMATREANTDGEGRITPAECIRGGMRMAMNRIIFGEMRDAEAAEAFIDVCASGHPGLSTIHARSAGEATTRLELFLGRAQKGVSRNVLNEQICTAVQVIVHLDICKVTKKRRVMEIKEIGPVAEGIIRQRDIFRYQLSGEKAQWRLLNRVSAHRDQIEALPEPVVLSEMPGVLEIGESRVLYAV